MTTKLSPLHANAARIIRSEAFNRTVADMQGVRFLDYDEVASTLTIGRGTPNETTVTAHDDGTISSDKPETLRASLGYTPRHSIFHNTTITIEHRANQLITEHTASAMNLDELGTSPHQLLPNSEVHRAARSAASTLGNGYVRDPDRMGIHALRTLLGKERLTEAVRIFGVHATLLDMNTLNQHRDVLTRAHALSANATLWWTRMLRNPADNDWDLTPEEIYQLAKDDFEEDYRNLPANHAWLPGASSADAWNAYTAIAPSAVNCHPPVPNLHTLIAGIIADAGVHPSFTMLTPLFRQKTADLCARPLHLATAAVTESARRLRARRAGTQRNLANTYYQLDYLRQVHPYSVPARELEARAAVPTFTEWLGILEAENDTPLRYSKAPARTQRRNDTSHTKDTVRAALYGPAQTEFTRALHAAVSLRVDPGRSVSLNVARTGTTVLQFTLHRDGTIKLTADEEHHWENATHLPAPDPARPVRSAPSTQGLVKQEHTLILRELTREMQQSGALDLGQRTAPQASALRIIEEHPEDFGSPETDTALTRRLRRAVATLMDKSTAAVCIELCGHVPIPLYNSVISSTPTWTNLLQTNPGAAAWAALRGAFQITGDNPQPPPSHPGQVVAWVKADLAAHGLTKAHWKHTATLRPRTVQACWKTNDTAWSVRLLRAMATIRSELEQSSIEALRPHLSEWYSSEDRAGYFAALAAAAARDLSPQQLELLLKSEQEMSHYINASDPLPSSRTLGGLAKATRAWHRQMTGQRIRAHWDQKLIRSGGRYPAWNSLIDTFEHSGHTFTAITDEAALTHESLSMDHCAFAYGDQCAQAQSRLFSISHGDVHIGTAELAPESPNSWAPLQVKGWHNHPLPAQVRLAAHALSVAYTKAAATARTDHHRQWALTTAVPTNPVPFPRGATPPLIQINQDQHANHYQDDPVAELPL